MPTRYRPDIDGLRALAVMAVILFHAFPNVMPGGFVGVDIFFVISGYLITQIVLDDLENGKFRASHFYARRIRRIFPALILVLIVTFALGWRSLLPAEFISLGKNIAASALFSANLMLLSEVGYFDIAAHMKPLLHLWSLGIEEQFYLLWPWMLVLISRRWLAATMVLLIVGSFALNVGMIGAHPSEVFYLPFTRAWELLAGAILTQLPAVDRRQREIAAIGGLSAILASLFLFDAKTEFPGWAAAVPVIGTMLLIVSEGSALNRIALSNRTAVSVGLISYPLYLWHWPLLVFAALAKFKPLTHTERGLIIGATFILAWATYRILEKPIRFGAYKARKTTIMAAAMGCIAICGSVTVAADGFPTRIPEIIRDAALIVTKRDGMRYGECLLVASADQTFPSKCIDDGMKPLLFVWGDSTAAVLAGGLNQVKDATGYRLAQMTVNSCPPVLAPDSYLVPFCVEANQKILSQLAASKPEIVLLHAAWDSHYTAEVMRPTIEALKALHVPRIVIVGPSPQWAIPLPQAFINYFTRYHQLMPERTTLFLNPQLADHTVRQAASDLGVEYFSAKDAMCDESGCLTRTGPTSRDISTSDFIHLTPTGSKVLALALIEDLKTARLP
jgi:peptidoglycan/LPS O-acetylase OafA/YrhL